MRFPSLAACLSLPAILVPLASAVFADEAYQIDYHHQLLGTPQTGKTIFHRPSPTSKASLLYALSEKLVLGAINPKDGGVVWRQWLQDDKQDENETGFLKAVDGEDVVVSAVGNHVRAWDAADGRLSWDWSGDGPVRSLEVVNIEGLKGDVLVMTEADGKSNITRLGASSGQVIWSHTDESGDIPVAISASATSIYYISLHSKLSTGYKTKIASLDIATGKLGAFQTVLNTESDVSSKDSILYVGSGTTAPLLIWADHKSKHLNVNVIGSKLLNALNFAHKDGEIVESISVHAPRSPIAQPHFLIQYQAAESHWAEVYHVDISKSSVKLAFQLPRLGGRGAFSTSTVDANVYFTRISEFEIALISSASHGVLGRWPIRPESYADPSDPEGIINAVSEVVSKDGSNFAVRSALTLPSGDWALVRNGEPVWVRLESLAGVVAAAFADIPVETDLAKELAFESHDNPLAAYIHRVKRHARDLRQFPQWLQQTTKRIIASFSKAASRTHEEVLQRDVFGFRKILILATEKGRVVALDAGFQGRLIWTGKIASIPKGSRWNVTNIEVENDSATILVAGEEPIYLNTRTGEWKSFQYDAVTGSTPDSKTYYPSHHGSQSLVLVSADGIPGKTSLEGISGTTVAVTRSSPGSIAGWAISDSFESTMVWEFFPAPGETISGLTTRPVHDPVASIGRALGDRNVLYKYLSPNLLLVTALNTIASTASVYLLDTVTGQVLFTTTHSGVDTSHHIPTAFAENWFAYSIFSDPSASQNQTLPLPKAHQLIITELYESPLPNDRGLLGSDTNYSAFAAFPLPHAISAAFVIPAPITHLTTTSTLQGITPRALLAAIPSLSALISIPLLYLSPRRPVGRDPTSSEQEEGLFRYSPLLDFNPHWITTHKREVLGIRGVTTTPTLMESTSAVVAWGDVDVFGTRVSPIGSFDTLGRGFSRIQLVGTVLALGLGTAILGPMVRKKQINSMWKT